MRVTRRIWIVAGLLGGMLSAGSASGEGFLSWLNPFASSDTEAATAATSEDRLASIRERLAERGLSTEEIDDRITQFETARASGEMPSLDQIRAKLEERGIDSSTLESRVAEFTAARESGLAPSFRDGEGAPTGEDLRARMEERGLSTEEIDDRIMRIEEARATIEAGGTIEMPEDFEERMARFREMMASRGR